MRCHIRPILVVQRFAVVALFVSGGIAADAVGRYETAPGSLTVVLNSSARVPARVNAKTMGPVLELPEDLFSQALWSWNDSASEWSLTLAVPGAVALKVQLAGQRVDTSRVWITDKAGLKIGVPWALSHGESSEKTFWSPLVGGSTLNLKISGPLERESLPRLARIAVAWREILEKRQSNDACMLDANCYIDNLVTPSPPLDPGQPDVLFGPFSSGRQLGRGVSGRSVARIVFVDDGQLVSCSGVLLATPSMTPYLLTSYHCVPNSEVADTVEAFWWASTGWCNGPSKNLNDVPRSVGATFRAGREVLQGDFALLELNNVPVIASFSNWTTEIPVLGQEVVAVHHGGDGSQKLSFGVRAEDADAYLDGDLAPEHLYYQVSMRGGSVGPGSSGSPLFDASGRVVGILSGANLPPDSCENDSQMATYSRFSVIHERISDFMTQGRGAPRLFSALSLGGGVELYGRGLGENPRVRIGDLPFVTALGSGGEGGIPGGQTFASYSIYPSPLAGPPRRRQTVVAESAGVTSNAVPLGDYDFLISRVEHHRIDGNRAVGITVTGEGFEPGSVARLVGVTNPFVPVTTRFVNSSTLEFEVPAERFLMSDFVARPIVDRIINPDGSHSSTFADPLLSFVNTDVTGDYDLHTVTPTVDSVRTHYLRGQGATVTVIKGSEFFPTTGVGLRGPDHPPGFAAGTPSWFIDSTTMLTAFYPSFPVDSGWAWTVWNPDAVFSNAVPIRIEDETRKGGIDLLGIVNAFSFRPGPVAPGEFLSIFLPEVSPETPLTADGANGSLPTSLGGFRVLFDGESAPIQYVGRGQINAIVPDVVDGRDETTLRVELPGLVLGPAVLSVAQAQPGLAIARGGTEVAAINEDGTLNGSDNRALPGSTVSLFAVGVGLMSSRRPVGSAASAPLGAIAADVEVLFFDQSFMDLPLLYGRAVPQHGEILYAGEAPGYIGLAQINVRVPQFARHPDKLPLILRVGDGASQLGTVLWVR